MIGIHVWLSTGSWRPPMRSDYVESYVVPPPSTVYGALLSLVGETDPTRHVGCRVTASHVCHAGTQIVLAHAWRQKTPGNPRGVGDNKTIRFEEIFHDVQIILWVDSSDESTTPTLEQRLIQAENRRFRGRRFGIPCVGNATDTIHAHQIIHNPPHQVTTFLLPGPVPERRRSVCMPVWVDFSKYGPPNRAITGYYVPLDTAPPVDRMPQIAPRPVV